MVKGLKVSCLLLLFAFCNIYSMEERFRVEPIQAPIIYANVEELINPDHNNGWMQYNGEFHFSGQVHADDFLPDRNEFQQGEKKKRKLVKKVIETNLDHIERAVVHSFGKERECTKILDGFIVAPQLKQEIIKKNLGVKEFSAMIKEH
jgi:hypothetical protein